MQNDQEKQSLLAKLKDKLRKAGKPLAALAIAGSLLFSSGCGNTNNPPEYEQGTENNGNENNNGQNGGEQNNPYAQYSQILQNVLTDEYYTELIYRTLTNYELTQTGYYDPHPYAFLEDEGYDIDKIKNGELECASTSYLKGNDYYIQTKVETKSDEDYYTCYTLKYHLTDAEIKDLNSLFPKFGTTTKYYQAPLFIQEVSYCKDPVVCSTAHLTKTCAEAISDKINSESVIDDYITTGENFGKADFILLGNYGQITVNNGNKHNYFEILVYPTIKGPNTLNRNAVIGKVKISLNTTHDLPIKEMNNVNVLSFINSNGMLFSTIHENEFKSNKENVTFYNCQQSELNTPFVKVDLY